MRRTIYPQISMIQRCLPEIWSPAPSNSTHLFLAEFALLPLTFFFFFDWLAAILKA